LYFQENLGEARALAKDEEPRHDDDYVYVGDASLGVAPADPGTYEGDDAKPSAVPLADSSLMNKWCARERERSALFVLFEGCEPTPRNLEQPLPNMGHRR